jgi:5'-phosphate synthase pdxT subunit
MIRADAGQSVGILALQGDFDAHARAFADLGTRVAEVRRPDELAGVSALVIPGGESTTLLKLLDFDDRWWPALADTHRRGVPILGTCAGLILLASDVRNPAQRSLGILDCTVERNAYGRQIDSHVATGAWRDGTELEMVFIRAPKITRVGRGVEVLAHIGGDPVLVRCGAVFGATFHPELTRDRSVQRALLEHLATPPASAEFQSNA